MYEIIDIFDVKAVIKNNISINLETSINLDTSGLVIEVKSKVVDSSFTSFLDKTLGNQPHPYGSSAFIRFDPVSKSMVYFIYAENIDSVNICDIKENGRVLNGRIYFKENTCNESYWKKCLINKQVEEIIFCSNINLENYNFDKLLINSSSYFILNDSIIEGIAIDMKEFYVDKWSSYEFDFIKKYLQIISKENWLKNDEEVNLRKINNFLKSYRGSIFTDDIDKLLEDFDL